VIAHGAEVQKSLVIGGTTYTLDITERQEIWCVEARQAPSGMRIGPTATAPTADEAIARLTRWLEWQRDHQDALTALQAAQQAYHRAIAGSAFSSGLAEATELQQEALQRIEDARLRLDEVRQAKPEIH
jgi:hypothetical protein